MSVTPDEGRTHWHGCEREHGHHACALAEIDRLRAEADAERICVLELRAQLDRANATAIQCKDELARLRAELERVQAATAEAIICDCIPGGSICDPQQVADAIRAWTKEPPA